METELVYGVACYGDVDDVIIAATKREAELYLTPYGDKIVVSATGEIGTWRFREE